MAENWLNPNLCSFDELVRVEKGPQIVELPCTDENLSDKVTAPHYRIGGRDADGKIIRPKDAGPKAQKQALLDSINMYGESKDGSNFFGVNEGDTMRCVDYKQKHKPHLWKVYQSQEFEQLNHKTGEMETISKFIKVDEEEGKDDALDRARAIRKEMK